MIHARPLSGLGRWLAAFAVGCGLWAGPLCPASAQDLSGFRHTHWSPGDGAPVGIHAIAQTTDGFLWLGASSGLYRFDGITFQHIAPLAFGRPHANLVTAMAAGQHGDLWVGLDYGGIALYRGGALHPADRVTAHGRIVSIVTAPQGDVWALAQSAFGSALLHFDGRRWQVIGLREGLPDEMVQALCLGRDGALWLATLPHLYRLAPGSGRFERQGFEIGLMPAFAEDEAGRLWVHSQAGLRPVAGGQHGAAPLAGTFGGRTFGQAGLLFDHHGALWVTGGDGGLRIAGVGGAGPLHPVTHPSPIETLFRDREGTIWGGSGEGLDRYVVSAITPFPVPGTIRSGLVQPATGGGAFTLVTDRGGYALAAGHLRLLHAARDLDIACGGGGKVALVGGKTKLLFENGKPRALPFASPQYPVQGCAIDSQGAYWETTPPLGVFRWDGKGLVKQPGLAGGQQLVALAPAGLIAVRPLGDVVLIADGRARVIWKAADIAIGFIKLVKQDGPFVYLGGDGGLARYDGRRMAVLSSGDYPWLQNVTGLVRQGADSWLIGDQGIMRLPTAALDRAFAHPGTPVEPQPVGAGEGIVARLLAYIASDAVADAAGQLWFNTNQGLVRVDPSRRASAGLPPPVSITQVSVDGHNQDPGQLHIPKGVSRIEIRYAGLSLIDPRNNRYRYRLDGVDQGWVEAGHGRMAAYVNLAPGSYHFRVTAAGVDGVWNTTGASLDFTVPPFFWQRWWFRAVLGLGLCGLLLGAVRWQLRAEVRRARLGFEARTAERERIARELHDTLLQGFHGLMMRFQAVALKVQPGSEAQVMIESALARGDDVLVQARDRVRDLRSGVGTADLCSRLETLAASYREQGFLVRVASSGVPPALEAECVDEAIAVVEEALANIARHARAREITIETQFRRRRMTVGITDDGIGMPAAIAQAMRREGHYGLVGMQERAAKLHGTLRVAPVAPHGTKVVLTIPVLAKAGRALSWPGR